MRLTADLKTEEKIFSRIWRHSNRNNPKWDTERKKSLTKIWTEYQWAVEHFWMASYMCNWSSQKRAKTAGSRKIFEEIMAKVLPNLRTIINPQSQEASWDPSIKDMKKTTSRHIIIKLLMRRQLKLRAFTWRPIQWTGLHWVPSHWAFIHILKRSQTWIGKEQIRSESKKENTT